MSFSIKHATVQDAAAISKIHALSWKSAYRGIVPQNYLDGIQDNLWVGAFQKWITENVFTADLLLLDDEVVGCITYGKSRDDSFSDWGEIVSIYIHPDHYGKGYGQKLMGYALDQLKAGGFKNCFLWVLAANTKARRFYEKSGFVWDGEEGHIEIRGKKLTDLRYVCRLFD